MSAGETRRYYGKYRGAVINNVDPMQQGRLQVQVPDVLGLNSLNWAMPCLPFAGRQMGMWCLPQIGAGVWVEFEQGDPDFPVWTGCWYANASEVPALALTGLPVSPSVLLQTQDHKNVAPSELRVVTRLAPTAQQMQDLAFAWKVAKFVKSNAIVYAREDRTLGIGAGQMSRVDSARIAVSKAKDAGLDLRGCAVASDAFFPFADGLLQAAEAGATCVIQPGGSVRDDEVIAAANEHGITMVFTHQRHFRH